MCEREEGMQGNVPAADSSGQVDIRATPVSITSGTARFASIAFTKMVLQDSFKLDFSSSVNSETGRITTLESLNFIRLAVPKEHTRIAYSNDMVRE